MSVMRHRVFPNRAIGVIVRSAGASGDIGGQCVMDNNIVSVGMPTYNNARTVTRAMESVFAQSHTKWRLTSRTIIQRMTQGSMSQSLPAKDRIR